MYELAIGAISLAIAVGQVVAAPKKERWKTIVVSTVAGCILIAGIAGYQFYQTWQHNKIVQRYADQVLSALDRPQSFDDIYNRMNFKDFGLVNEGFDHLFEEKLAEHRVVQMQGPGNQTYAVRLFFKKGEWK
jgi:hypothetical protein